MSEARSQMTVYVQPTTGGRLEFCLPLRTSVHNLKCMIAKRLRVAREKIVLLHRNKQLSSGSLLENNISEGARLTLLPTVETGTAAPNAEQCVMQALETLNDSQVDGFLAGRAPLNLSMRLGDHVMFVQLQLSALPDALTPPATPTTPLSSSSLPFPDSATTSNKLDETQLSPPPSPVETGKENCAGRPNESAGLFSEASRHLTHTLRQLSSSALARKMNETCDGRCGRARRDGGAVIESMFHHGHGVFSGTFTGTLSPFLQDREGRPRRNICTVVHILNDLLGASSHCNSCAGKPQQDTQLHNHTKESPPQSFEDGVPSENDALRSKVRHIRAHLENRNRLREKRRLRRSTPYHRASAEDSSETIAT